MDRQNQKTIENKNIINIEPAIFSNKIHEQNMAS